MPKIVQKKSHYSKNIGRKNESDWDDRMNEIAVKRRGIDEEKIKIQIYNKKSDRETGRKYGNDESDKKKHRRFIGEREDSEERINERKHCKIGRRENGIHKRKYDEKRRRSDSNDLENRGKGTSNEKSNQSGRDRKDKANGSKREHKHESKRRRRE